MKPQLWRTHSVDAYRRASYPKTAPPNTKFEFVCDFPDFRDARKLRLHVDRKEDHDAEAILVALHSDQLRICFLEQDFRIQRVLLEPNSHSFEFAVDDTYVFIMANVANQLKHSFDVFSRATGDLVLSLPSSFLPPMTSFDLENLPLPNRYFIELNHDWQDASRPARWGPTPSFMEFTQARPLTSSGHHHMTADCRCWQNGNWNEE